MFDPLHKWLGIPPGEQPPHHYRLLGIEPFEGDAEVIDVAADKQLAFLHDLTNGERAEIAERLSNQVSAARICLLNEKKKRAYDEVLRGQLERSAEAVSRSSVGPAYDVSQPRQSDRDSSAAVQVGKRRESSRSRVKPRRLWNFSTLLCIIALGLIGIGLQQGQIVLDLSLLESLGLTGATQSPSSPESDTLAQAPPQRPTVQPSPPRPKTAAERETGSSDAPPPRPSSTKRTPTGPQRSEGTPPRSLGDLVHSASGVATDRPIVKKPLPSESQLDEKLALIRELYEEEYLAANTRSTRIELARLMHREGQMTVDDPIGRFALWRVARDILTLEGEFAAAIAIVENLDAHYIDVDAKLLKVETIRNAAGQIADASLSRFLDAALDTIAVCRQSERFELVNSICDDLEQELGSRLTDTRLAELKQAESNLREAEASFARHQQAQQKLEQSEDDPEANGVAGHYLCFVRSEWQRGLPYLSRADESAVRSAARLELASPDNVTERIAVADAWLDVAETAPEAIAQTTIRRHALDWYRNAEHDAEGLDGRKVESRIAELERLLPLLRDQPDSAAGTSPENVLGYRMSTSALSRSDFADRKGNKFTVGMGLRPDGRGEAMAGIELQGVKRLAVDGSASHQELVEVGPYSKTGFVIDYHTPGGYARRVFLGCGLKPGRRFSGEPAWGTANPPEIITDIGRNNSYEIDLQRWAPSTWDGRCWFTIYMQNCGDGRTLFATVSW
jgi:hypothetical protein